MEIPPGTLINGKYRVEHVLGEGGMGFVVAAKNERLGREVALKFLHPTLTRRPEIVKRFLNEARAAVQLRHPNIVDTLDVDEDENGSPFLVLELLVGESLAALLARVGALSFDDACAILIPAMEGIAVAHGMGIVHRDLKPDNIFLHRDGRGDLVPKVLDFGIAKAADAATNNNTATASMLGTPLYMAPEQILDSKRATAASDVWSMGIVWCECLAGTLPHTIDPNAPQFQVLTWLVKERPRSLEAIAPHLAHSIVAVVDRALAADPKQRYADTGAFARALELVREPSSAPRGVRERDREPRASAPRLIAPTVALASASVRAVVPASSSATPTPLSISGATHEPRSRKTIAVIAASLGLAVAVLFAVIGLTWRSDRSTPPPPPVATDEMSAVTATHPPIAPLPAADVPPAPPPLAVVAGPAPLAELLVRWRHLDPSARDLVRFAEQGSALVALAPPSDAVRIAAFFGEAPNGLESGASVLVPRIARAGQRLRVLNDATGAEVAGVIAAGTALVVIEGQINGYESQVDREGGRVRVVASTTLEGWVSAAEIDPWTTCIPSLDELDGGRRAFLDAQGPPARSRDPMFVLFELGTPGWVSIASHDGACLLDTIAVATTDLPIAEVFLTRTAADSGSLIVMIGRWASDGGEADALIRWSADTVIPSEHQFNRVWGIDLYSGHALDETTREQIVGPLVVRPGRGSGFWPLRVRQGGQMTYYVWREAAFLLPATLVPEP